MYYVGVGSDVSVLTHFGTLWAMHEKMRVYLEVVYLPNLQTRDNEYDKQY